MNIVLYGNPVLLKKSTDVENIDEELRQILDEMIKLTNKAEGIGLAANQIGIDKRFFVLNIEGEIRKVINPEIIEYDNEIVDYEEGCLSIPDIYKVVSRPNKIKVKYQNEKGETVEEEFDGIWSRAFQHEFDHINGVLFIDRLTPVRKRLISSKMEKLKKNYKKGIRFREIKDKKNNI